jgi:hypothetical protein
MSRQCQQLAVEQLNLIPGYRQKWQTIACTTTAADFVRVRTAIRYLYHELGLSVPEMKKFQGPETMYWQALACDRLPGEQLQRWGSLVLNGFGGFLFILLLCGMIPMLTSVKAAIPMLLWWLGLVVLLICDHHFKGPQRSNPLFTNLYVLLFYLFPLLYLWSAWTLRNSRLIAVGIASLPVVFALVIGLSSVFNHYRLESQWSRRIAIQVYSQLSRSVQQQLTKAWAADRLLPAPADRERPIGYFPIARWSYEQFPKEPAECFTTFDWIDWCAQIDFCICVLGCPCDQQLWSAFQTLICECGLVLPLRRSCWVCDRPTRIALDQQGRLHAEGKAAIAFGDGSYLYALQGIKLPPAYGSRHPHQWQADWVLKESNAELRRILIQGIGYGRLCQELNARTLDIWREYVLLKVEIPGRTYVQGSEVKEEPIYLLKMVCPSTQHIHVLRVPPKMRSAKTAARWINWDIDPESFVLES